MAEKTLVTDIEAVLEAGLQSLFENLDEVATEWEAASIDMLEQLRLSLADLDITYEYQVWIEENWLGW